MPRKKKERNLRLVATGPLSEGVAHPEVRIAEDTQSGHLVISNDSSRPIVVGLRHDEGGARVEVAPDTAEIAPRGTNTHYLIYEDA